MTRRPDSAAGTRCRCGALLARDNRDSMCSACRQKMRYEAPHPPAEFWEVPPLATALGAHDMGAVIREYRRHPWHGRGSLPQGQVASWGGVTQGQLSRLENGHSKIRDLDRLIAWARALAIPEHLLWFTLPPSKAPRSSPAAAPALRALAPALVDAPAEPYIAVRTLNLVRDYAEVDNLIGPRALLRPVGLHLNYLNQVLDSAENDRGRRDLLRAAARTAELLGWLYQDAGDLRSAVNETDRALRYSMELGDSHLEAYALMRKATMASDAGDATRSLTLCEAALRKWDTLTPRLRAVILRQRAAAHTLRKDTAQVMACIDQARSHLDEAHPDDDPSAELTAYVTHEYLDMEAAACLVRLGQGDRAVETIERGLATWRPEFRRELGVCLARASSAYTAIDDVEQAQAAAHEAMRIANESRSARTIRELHHARRAMITRGLTDPADALGDGLRSLHDDPPQDGGRKATSQ